MESRIPFGPGLWAMWLAVAHSISSLEQNQLTESAVFLYCRLSLFPDYLWSCELSNSYTMGCPPIRGDNPRALASGLSYVQVDKHGITILYHLHQCKPRASRDSSC